MKNSLIKESIQIARRNREKWHDVFEHRGSLCDNPLLAEPARFTSFLNEYSVGRTIKKGTHQKLREGLAKSRRFHEAILDDSGGAIDSLGESLRRDFGTHDGRRIVSALSKVAAFVRPERFVAWDTYAKRGVNVVLGRAASSSFKTYADYLARVDEAWKGKAGQEIREYVIRDGILAATESEIRFQRRVLDAYLMKRGGRKLKARS